MSESVVGPVEEDYLVSLMESGESIAWRDPRDGSMNPITAIADVDGEPCAIFKGGTRASLLSALAEDFFKVTSVFESGDKENKQRELIQQATLMTETFDPGHPLEMTDNPLIRGVATLLYKLEEAEDHL